MPGIGDALFNLGSEFAKMKQDSMELSINAREAELAQDLAIRASTKLDQDFENAQPGQFNADEQIKWYDSEVEKLTSSIRNEDQRTKFKSLLNRNRGSFAISAEGKALQSLQDQETESINSIDNNFYLGLADETKDPIQDVLIGTLDSYSYYKQAGTRTTRKTLDTREDNAILAALNSKAERLKNQFATGAIKRDQYIAGIEGLEAPLREAGLFDTLSGDVRNKTLNTLETIKTNALVGGQEAQINNLTNNFVGEIASIESGRTPNLDYIQDVKEAHERFPENIALANMNTQLQIVSDNAEYFIDRSKGDLNSMASLLNDAKASLDKAGSGKEFELKQKTLAILQKNFTAARELFNTNTAEFFKDNPSVKLAQAKMLQNPDDKQVVSEYVSLMQNLVKQQGGDTTSFELLPDILLQSYRDNLKRSQKNPNQYQAQILKIRQTFSQTIDQSGTTAADLVIDQISTSGDVLDIIARYAGTTSFNTISVGLNMDQKELKQLMEKPNKLTDLRAKVVEAMGDNLILFASRNPGNQEAITAMIQAGTKLAMYSVLDINSDINGSLTEDDFGKAAKYANNLLFNNHQRTVNKDRVRATAPINEPQVEASLKQINNNPYPFLDKTIKDWAKSRSGGNVVLPGDIVRLVDMDALGGEGFESLDYNEMVDSLVVVDAPNGKDKALALNVFNDVTNSNVQIPFRLKDAKGNSELITFNSDEMQNTLLSLKTVTKADLKGTPGRLARGEKRGALIDLVGKFLFQEEEPVAGLNEFDKQADQKLSEAEKLRQEIEASTARMNALLEETK